MCWQKDPETAYNAVAPLCAGNPNLLFLHLGWGKWKQYLLEKAHDLGFGSRLRILAYVDDPTTFYHAIDAVIVTSRYEAGWPLVVLEAMACNLPIIASTCPGMSDLGNAGLSHVWSFPPEDVPACTRRLEDWLRSRTRGEVACNHRRYVMENLSPERSYGSTLDLYFSVRRGMGTPMKADLTAGVIAPPERRG
jgi:glycosyltransferase involved in cell wall biosynthesis